MTTSRNIGTDAEISKIRMNNAGDIGSTPDSGYVNLAIDNNRLMLKTEGGSKGIATSYYGEVIGSTTTVITTSQVLGFSGLITDLTSEASWDGGSARVTLPASGAKYYVNFTAFLDNSASPTGTFRALRLLDWGGSTVSVTYEPVSTLRYQKMTVDGLCANGFSIVITHDALASIAFGDLGGLGGATNPYGFFYRIY